jgi:hypothetical protein
MTSARAFSSPPLLLLLLLVLLPCSCRAWGRDAHAIVSDIAARHLSPKAKAACDKLLGGQSLASVSSWADDMTHTDKYHWLMSHHFVNVLDPSDECEKELTNCTFVYERDCRGTFGKSPLGYCVSGAIANYTSILKANWAKGTNPNNETSDALKFVIHFVGDIHQPLHTALARDRGGAIIDVKYWVPGQGEYWNLHKVWDFGILVNREGVEGNYSGTVEPEIYHFLSTKWKDEAAGAWLENPTDYNAWVQEGLDLAVKYAYRFANGTQIPHEAHRPKNDSLLIPRSYYDAYMCPGCVAEYALAKGGIRLANTLNLIFEEEEGAMMVQ